MRRLSATGPLPSSGYDIVVAGAGGAGVAFLEHIDTTAYKVLCIDRKAFPRHKACSGILVKEAIEYFGRSNIPDDVLDEPNVIDIEYVDRDNNSSRLVQKGFLSSDRAKLDTWHFSKIINCDFDFAEKCVLRKITHPDSVPPTGSEGPGRLEMTSRPFTPEQSLKKEVNGRSNDIILHLELGGQKFIVTCRTLIAADGATSQIRDELMPPERLPKKYFLIQEYFAGSPLTHGRFISDSRLSDYYGWVIPKNGRTEIGAAVETSGWRPRFDLFKEEIIAELGLQPQVLERQSFFSVRPRSTDQLFFGKLFEATAESIRSRVMLVGEAAGLISPSSAEGISFSLWSGRYAAEALNDAGNLEPLMEYKSAMIPWLDRLAVKMDKAREMRRPERRKKFDFRVFSMNYISGLFSKFLYFIRYTFGLSGLSGVGGLGCFGSASSISYVGLIVPLIFFGLNGAGCGPPEITGLLSDFQTRPAKKLSDFGGNTKRGDFLLVIPKTKSEVIRFMRLTKEHKIPYVITGAGHSKAGQIFPVEEFPDGYQAKGPRLVFVTTALNTISLGSDKKTVTVSAGALMEDVRKFVKEEAPAKALGVFPDGPGPTVGGFTAAGGMNASSFRYGGFWSSVKLVEVIYPDGTTAAVRPGNKEFPYLFGTAGQAAFVYSVTIELVEQPKQTAEWMVTTNGLGGTAQLLAVTKKLHNNPQVYGLLSNWAGADFQFHVRTPAGKEEIKSWFGGALAVKELRKFAGEPPQIRRKQKWFTFLVKEKDIPAAFQHLTQLYGKYKNEQALSFTGIYTYKIKQSKNMPKATFVTGHTGDFWKVGIQFLHKNAKKNPAVMDTKTAKEKSKGATGTGTGKEPVDPWKLVQAFEADFEKLARKNKYGRYLLSEYFAPAYRFEKLWGREGLKALRSFKEKHDPDMLMNYKKVFR